MSFFDEDDDPFDNIFRDFFGQQVGNRKRRETIIRGEEEDRVIDFIEDDEKVYLVFELPGFNEKDISVSVNNKQLEIKAKKREVENIQEYLMQKLHQGLMIQKTLPNFINSKKFSHTMRNGILEVAFSKK